MKETKNVVLTIHFDNQHSTISKTVLFAYNIEYDIFKVLAY